VAVKPGSKEIAFSNSVDKTDYKIRCEAGGKMAYVHPRSR